MALIGAWTGPEGLVFVIFVAAISGSLLGGLWLLKNRTELLERPQCHLLLFCAWGASSALTYPENSRPMASSSNFFEFR